MFNIVCVSKISKMDVNICVVGTWVSILINLYIF